MHELLKQILSPMTLGCIGLVFMFGIGTVFSMWRSAKLAVEQLDSLHEIAEDASDAQPSSALARAAIRPLDDGRMLLPERIEQLLEDWLQLHVLRLARFEAGGWITGVALFFTFFLIAWVLANDVGPAIATSGKQSMLGLSQAVRTMGAKFIVSMVGILLSIAHGSMRALHLRHLHTAVSKAAHRLRDKAVAVQDFQLECSQRQTQSAEALFEVTTAIHRAVTQQHTQSTERLEELRGSIEKLQSIEVSIQDIGSELSRSLQQTVRKDIVEGIRRELQEVADGMQQALANSFSSTLSTTMDSVVVELRKIEGAVASQGRSQLEELLQKLSDAVSGGFATESSRMKEALSRFAEVIPALEKQLRAISQSTGEDLAQRQAESSRTSAFLLERLTAILERTELQHQQTTRAAEQMQRIISEHQNAVADSAAQASQEFAHHSRLALGELTDALNGATSSAAQVYGSLVAEVEQSARLLQQARCDASDGAHQLAEASGTLRAILGQVAGVVTGLQEIGGALASGTQQARMIVENGVAALRSSVNAVTQHQLFIEELSARWPELTRQYLAASDQAFAKIAAAWQSQADHIGSSVAKIGDSFAGSAAEFAEAVQDLGMQLDRMRGDRTAMGSR